MHASDSLLSRLRETLAGYTLQGSSRVRYHLRDCVGEGGQGWVFRAHWDEPDGVTVIVKVLRPDAVGAEALSRFQREATVLRMLSQQARPNPHIVRFFDHSVAQVAVGKETIAVPFTVLEYVAGQTLEHELKARARQGLPLERIRRITRQIVLALEAVHAQKVVHRDLKPSNILLAQEGGAEIAKVTDFGLVKLAETNLHRTASLAGASLGYAPPEQYERGNKRVSERTDVFSLAAILHEMLTGTPAFPFEAMDNPVVVLTRMQLGPRPTLTKRDASPPRELQDEARTLLDREIQRALSADPMARHASIAAFWDAIEPALRPGTESRIPSAPKISPFQSTEPAFRDGPASVKPVRVSAPPAVSSAPPPASALPAGVWAWSVVEPGMNRGRIRAAAFDASGDGAVAVGPSGVARWQQGGWQAVAVPPAFDIELLKGALMLPQGDLLIYGEAGILFQLARTGSHRVIAYTERDMIFLGAQVDATGIITVVGERPLRYPVVRTVPAGSVGLVVQVAGDQLSNLGESAHSSRLVGVTRMADGSWLACGDFGHVIRLLAGGMLVTVGAICQGHLMRIVAESSGGAITVGAGGHALSLSSKLAAQLEPVQARSDLVSLALSSDGTAWAGSSQGRLLCRERDAMGGKWVRKTDAVGMSCTFVAVHASPTRVRAIGDDGTVLEGRRLP